MTRAPRASRWTALTLVATLGLPTLAVTAGCGHGGGGGDNSQVSTNAPTPMNNAPMNGAPAAKPGLSGKQKVVLLAGAAALFFLYKHYQKADTAQAEARPQLYREDSGPNKGAIYYHKNDANHTVVWLQAPAGGISVPADQAQQYVPGYDPNNPNAYQGAADINTNPQATNGAQVQTADIYANEKP